MRLFSLTPKPYSFKLQLTLDLENAEVFTCLSENASNWTRED